MGLTVRQEFQRAVKRVVLELIPPPHLRKPLTWGQVPSAFAYVIPLYFLAYLARRRDTRLIRILLLPTVLVTALRGTFNFYWEGPEYAFANWVRGVVGMAVIGLALDLAFTEGRLRVSEQQLPALNEDAPKANDDEKNSALLPPWLKEANEVVLSFRGIGWAMGQGVYIPPDPRPMERRAFLKATWVLCLKHFLLADLLIAIVKLVPGLNNPAGGTLYLHDLPYAPQLLFSTAVVAAAAAGMMSGIHTLYAAGTLIGVGLLDHPPSAWPPVMLNPWACHSVSDLWAKRWHQMLRRTFLVFGGIPGGWIAGRPGMVLGAFIASGLVHEFGIYVLGRGIDHRVTLFFSLQGVCVLLEVMWRRVTGYKVHGWGGRIWAYAFILVTGRSCLDAWFRRGLVASIFIPSWLSPVQSLLIPFACSILQV